MKKRLVLTTAVVAAAISASAAQAVGVPAGPPGGLAAQSGGEQAVPRGAARRARGSVSCRRAAAARRRTSSISPTPRSGSESGSVLRCCSSEGPVVGAQRLPMPSDASPTTRSLLLGGRVFPALFLLPLEAPELGAVCKPAAGGAQATPPSLSRRSSSRRPGGGDRETDGQGGVMRKIYAVTAAILAAGCLASSATAAPDPIKTSTGRSRRSKSGLEDATGLSLGEAQATLGCLGPISGGPVRRTFNACPRAISMR